MFYKTPYGSHYHTNPSCPAIAGHQAEPCGDTTGLEPCSICAGGSNIQESGITSAGVVTGTTVVGDTVNQDDATADALNDIQELDSSDAELTAQDIVTKSAGLTEAGRNLDARSLPETPPKKTILQRLNEIHVKVLEFLWRLVLPSPRKRDPWWWKYLGDDRPDISELPASERALRSQIAWSHVMNKRYGPKFGPYNPYMSEEDRKKLSEMMGLPGDPLSHENQDS